jgi:hypothetical protein
MNSMKRSRLVNVLGLVSLMHLDMIQKIAQSNNIAEK